MKHPIMLNVHQESASASASASAQAASCGRADTTPWLWSLEPRQATTLAAAPADRWLQVESGSAWLTRANGADQAEDIWLQAGENRVLPAGTEWVVEGWPQAQLSLHLQAQVLAPRGVPRFSPWAGAGWLRAGLRRALSA